MDYKIKGLIERFSFVKRLVHPVHWCSVVILGYGRGSQEDQQFNIILIVSLRCTTIVAGLHDETLSQKRIEGAGAVFR